MALNFNYSECDKDLLTDEVYAESCETVVFLTMFVGMPRITHENFSEFVMRVMIFDAANGGIYVNRKTRFEWSEYIRPWVGLHTNAAPETSAAFWKRMRTNTAEETMRGIRMWERAEAEKAGKL